MCLYVLLCAFTCFMCFYVFLCAFMCLHGSVRVGASSTQDMCAFMCFYVRLWLYMNQCNLIVGYLSFYVLFCDFMARHVGQCILITGYVCSYVLLCAFVAGFCALICTIVSSLQDLVYFIFMPTCYSFLYFNLRFVSLHVVASSSQVLCASFFFDAPFVRCASLCIQSQVFSVLHFSSVRCVSPSVIASPSQALCAFFNVPFVLCASPRILIT